MRDSVDRVDVTINGETVSLKSNKLFFSNSAVKLKVDTTGLIKKTKCKTKFKVKVKTRAENQKCFETLNSK